MFRVQGSRLRNWHGWAKRPLWGDGVADMRQRWHLHLLHADVQDLPSGFRV